MGSKTRLIIVLGCLVVLVGRIPALAQSSFLLNDGFSSEHFQDPSCSLSDTVGTYMVSCSGIVSMPGFLAPAPFTTPTGGVDFGYAGLGTVVIDSGGYARAPNACVNIGGNMILGGLEGQTKVNSDCTGTVRYYPFGLPRSAQGPNNWLLQVRFIILNGGHEIRGLVIGQQNCDANLICSPAQPAPVQCELKLMNRNTPVQKQNPDFCSPQ